MPQAIALNPTVAAPSHESFGPIMDIEYTVNADLRVGDFIQLLRSSGLGERRPTDDRECMEGMLSNSNLTVSAWEGDQLVGIARSVTDFHYACYLSDLAVRKEYQERGIGKQLQITTQEQLGGHCKLILLAAPQARSYYEHIGFTNHSDCWILSREEAIRD